MARFDLYRVEGWRIPLMVDVQTGYLDELATRVVIPLRQLEAAPDSPIPRLKPVLILSTGHYVLETPDLGSLPLIGLGSPVGNIAEHRDSITAALDFLLQGF